MIDPVEDKRKAIAGRRFWQRPMYVFITLSIAGLIAAIAVLIGGYQNYLKFSLVLDGVMVFCAALCWTQYEGWNTQIRNITESQEKGGEKLYE